VTSDKKRTVIIACNHCVNIPIWKISEAIDNKSSFILIDPFHRKDLNNIDEVKSVCEDRFFQWGPISPEELKNKDSCKLKRDSKMNILALFKNYL